MCHRVHFLIPPPFFHPNCTRLLIFWFKSASKFFSRMNRPPKALFAHLVWSFYSLFSIFIANIYENIIVNVPLLRWTWKWDAIIMWKHWKCNLMRVLRANNSYAIVFLVFGKLSRHKKKICWKLWMSGILCAIFIRLHYVHTNYCHQRTIAYIVLQCIAGGRARTLHHVQTKCWMRHSDAIACKSKSPLFYANECVVSTKSIRRFIHCCIFKTMNALNANAYISYK